MNTLSWLLYLAEVSGSLKSVLATVTGLYIITILSIIFYGAFLKDSSYSTKDEGWQRGHELQKSALTKYIFLPALTISGYCIIPSATTVYAIAASEMGEKVLTSQPATKAMKALDAWLDRQITPHMNKEEK